MEKKECVLKMWGIKAGETTSNTITIYNKHVVLLCVCLLGQVYLVQCLCPVLSLMPGIFLAFSKDFVVVNELVSAPQFRIPGIIFGLFSNVYNSGYINTMEANTFVHLSSENFLA